MRHIPLATLLAAVSMVTGAQALAAEGAKPLRTASIGAPSATNVAVSSASDADLLAERHLALYRATRLPAVQAGNASTGDDTDAAPPIVRTSATAALPLPPHPAEPRTISP